MTEQLISKNELVEYRLTKLESQYAEIKADFREMMEVLNRLDKKLSNVPDGGLNCNLHAVRMDSFRKELDDHKIILDGLQQFKWRAVGVLSVVMLLAQLLGATIFDRTFRPSTPSMIPIKVEVSIPGITNATSTVNK
jgi:hypothetical protein